MFPISDVIPSKTTPVVTVGLMILNALVFVYELQLSRPELQLFAQAFGVVPAYFAWPTLVSSMFLHEGWMHLLGNMLFLWIFGDNLEHVMGRARYLIFYLVTGLAASLAHVVSTSRSATTRTSRASARRARSRACSAATWCSSRAGRCASS